MLIPVICMGYPIYLGIALWLPLKEFKTFYRIGKYPAGCSFEVKGVFVRDNKPVLQNVQSPKIKYLPVCDKRNQTQPIKRNRESLTELYKKTKNS